MAIALMRTKAADFQAELTSCKQIEPNNTDEN